MNTVVTITTVMHILFRSDVSIYFRQKVGEYRCYHNIYLMLHSPPFTFNKKWASNVVIIHSYIYVASSQAPPSFLTVTANTFKIKN